MLTEREEDVPQLKHARSIATKALVEWLEAPALKA
jgi:hypothetical protein